MNLMRNVLVKEILRAIRAEFVRSVIGFYEQRMDLTIPGLHGRMDFTTP
jgi:hypothetical protein